MRQRLGPVSIQRGGGRLDLILYSLTIQLKKSVVPIASFLWSKPEAPRKLVWVPYREVEQQRYDRALLGAWECLHCWLASRIAAAQHSVAAFASILSEAVVLISILILGTLWQRVSPFRRIAAPEANCNFTPCWTTACRWAVSSFRKAHGTPQHLQVRRHFKIVIIKAKQHHWRKFSEHAAIKRVPPSSWTQNYIVWSRPAFAYLRPRPPL